MALPSLHDLQELPGGTTDIEDLTALGITAFNEAAENLVVIGEAIRVVVGVRSVPSGVVRVQFLRRDDVLNEDQGAVLASRDRIAIDLPQMLQGRARTNRAGAVHPRLSYRRAVCFSLGPRHCIEHRCPLPIGRASPTRLLTCMSDYGLVQPPPTRLAMGLLAQLTLVISYALCPFRNGPGLGNISRDGVEFLFH